MKRFAILVLACTALTAQAQEEDRSGWRIGLGAAFSEYEEDSKILDDSQVGFNLNAAYRFNDWIGIEGGYFNSTDFQARLPSGTSPATVSIAYQGFYVSALGYAPISDEIDLFVKGGFFDFNSQLTTEGGVDSNARTDGALFGGGAILHISDDFGIKAEFDYFDVDEADLWTIILGVEYMF